MKEIVGVIEGLHFKEIERKQWEGEMEEPNYINALADEALASGVPVHYNGMIISAEREDDVPGKYDIIIKRDNGKRIIIRESIGDDNEYGK